MELFSKIVLGFLTLVFLSFVAGFIDTWWEQHKREKEAKKRR